MAESVPDKKEIELIFRRLRAIPTNKVCFDCTAKNPTWASVTYGVFICIDCSAVHRSLGVHLTFVRSTQLDTNWTWPQIRQMQLGGNANAESFFQQHNCLSKDAQQKYNSRAAQLYKEKLHSAALQAMKLHGTKLHLEQEPEASPVTSPKEEYDFFEDHSQLKDALSSDFVVEQASPSEENRKILKSPSEPSPAPSVAPNSPALPLDKKALFGSRKPQAKKLGVGNRRSSGLGAQKSAASFAEAEKEAELSEKLKVQSHKEPDESPKHLEPEQMVSMRLAYEDLSLKQKKEEEKLKAIDPKKASQMERLGMGLGARTGISHSAVNDMKTIHQENSSKITKTSDLDMPDIFDEYGLPSTNLSLYNLKATVKNKGSRSFTLGSEFEESFTSPSSSWTGSQPVSSSERDTKSQSRFSSNSSSYSSQNNNSTPRNSNLPSPSGGVSTDAQKKFGGAKSISSDQFFSDSLDKPDSIEQSKASFRSLQCRDVGGLVMSSSSISSADYFGRDEQAYQRGGGGGGYISSQLQPPDLGEVRESVKQGVSKVAGRLSSIASGVFSTIQDKYGGY